LKYALANPDGKVGQDLEDGQTIRQSGCHTRIVPKDENKIKIWLLILELKKDGWGFKRIAAHLNALGVPSPDAGRTRTDSGVKHFVNGKWGPNTIRDLCRNKAILGVLEFGRRSEGAHRRLSKDGPRTLLPSDKNSNGKPKFIDNDDSIIIKAPAGYGSLYSEDEWNDIRQKIELRGKNQRGISRGRDMSRYPLSCRVFDLTDNCGALMYGLTSGKRALYLCGRYNRTAGAECDHNAVDAEALLKFTLVTIRDSAMNLSHREKLREMLLELARQEAGSNAPETDPIRERLEKQIRELRVNQKTAERHFATEVDDALRQVLRDQVREIKSELDLAESQLNTHVARQPRKVPSATPDLAVEEAMALLDNIEHVATDKTARTEINPLMERLGIRIGLEFVSVTKGTKRSVRKLAGGVIAFGNADLPVKIHGDSNAEPKAHGPGCASQNGPAQTPAIHGQNAIEMADDGTQSGPSSASVLPTLRRKEGISLTKVNRGDMI
jgi:hypothetical protein